LIKAVARAHRWREMLTSGEADSIESIARRFGLDRGHVGLTLNLAFLSPALTRAILKGEQPSGLRLIRLLDAEIPLSWREQEEVFGPMQKALSAASPSPA
jgi:site-specific DNA recombinase